MSEPSFEDLTDDDMEAKGAIVPVGCDPDHDHNWACVVKAVAS